tara:strand:+ start:861 stop:2594 length:1734 start_codon:yes stop_codon:yes gene_type:complete
MKHHQQYCELRPSDMSILEAKSKDGKPCPCCVANDHIAEIKKIQAGIENRGGVFVSKRQHHYDAQLMSHKDWMKQWQRAKVLCAGAIELLSQLNDNHPEHAEKCSIKEALHIWNSAAEDCGQVPGYRYVQEKLENSGHEDGRSVRVRKDDSHDEMSLAAQELQELWADDREWVIRPKRKSRKSRHTSSTASLTLDFGFSRTVNNAFDSKSWHIQRAAKDVTSVDDDVLKDMEDVTDRLNDQLNMGDWNISDAIAAIGIETIENAEANIDPSTVPLPPSPVKATLRSALKITRPSGSNNVLPASPAGSSRKQLNFADHTTVISDHTHSSISSAVQGPVQQPHSRHTTAENSHLRRTYNRASPFYHPFTSKWASPEGCEKVETSFYSMTWDELNKANKREDNRTPPIKATLEPNSGISKDSATTKQDSEPLSPDFEKAMDALNDETMEGNKDKIHTVTDTHEWKEQEQTNIEVLPNHDMHLILHPTAGTNTATNQPSLDAATDLTKKSIFQARTSEHVIVNKVASMTSERQTRDRFAQPRSSTPSDFMSTQTATAHLRPEYHQISSGLMFGVGERESER